MPSKDEIVKAILRVTGGDENKEFTKTAIAHELGMTKSTTTIDKIIKELESEGFIKFKEKRGQGIYYVLAKKQVEEKKAEEHDMKNLKDALREVLEEYFGKPKSFADLDRTYDFMKDSLGYVRIDNLRKQLGMSIEQFMAKFGDYILQHYELIPGGEEGFIKGGVMYGIIRRKR
ncbi:helix-turn-helix domain-containing protein [Acidianus ambivalens]|nr:helix-turn-helix domain-containing protein [Acidianus ambivalens]